MAANYKVITQAPVKTLGVGGQFQDAIEITIETLPSKQVGRVVVPTVQYNPAEVAEVLDALAHVIETVQGL